MIRVRWQLSEIDSYEKMTDGSESRIGETIKLINQKDYMLQWGKNLLKTIPILAICSFYIPLKQVFAQKNDYLDHYFVLQKMWSEQVPLFNYSVRIDGVLDSINPNALGFADLNPTIILGKIFSPTSTYVITELTLRILGFIGFYLLINESSKINYIKIHYIGALLFASLDVPSAYAPTLFLAPLLIHLLLKSLKNKWKLSQYLIVFFIWQWMGIIYGGFFILFLIVILSLNNILPGQIKHKHVLFMTSWNIFSAIFASYRLLLWQFQQNQTSHRADWSQSPDTQDFFLSTLNVWLKTITIQNSQLNGANLTFIYIWLLFYVFYRGFKINFRNRYLIYFFLYSSAILMTIIEEKMKLLANIEVFFQLSRISVFIPLISIFLLTKKTQELIKSQQYIFKQTLSLILTISISLSFPQPYNIIRNNLIDQVRMSKPILNILDSLFLNSSDLKENSESISDKLLKRKAVTISEYFQEEKYRVIYNELKMYQDNPKVISLGLDPMVASYNGYRSFDGYVFNYELSYKDRFRPIIAEVLVKDINLKEYFDNWGNRVYVFLVDEKTNLINFCYAKSIGVDFVLFERNTLVDERIHPIAHFEGLTAARIVCGET